MPFPEVGTIVWATDGSTRCGVVVANRARGRRIRIDSLNNLNRIDLSRYTVRESREHFEQQWQTQPRIAAEWLNPGSIWRPIKPDQSFDGVHSLVIINRLGNGTVDVASISQNPDPRDTLDSHGLCRRRLYPLRTTALAFMSGYARVWYHGQEHTPDHPESLYPELLYHLRLLHWTESVAPPKPKRKPRRRKPKVKPPPPAWYDRLDDF